MLTGRIGGYCMAARMTLKKALSYSPVKLSNLRRKADSGDESAQLELSAIADKITKEANRRLKRLERNNMTQYAYELAADYIRTTRDDNNIQYQYGKGDYSDMYGTILSARTFISKKTSLVKGQKEVQRQRIESFRESLDLTRNRFSKDYMTNAEISKFLEFLGNKPIRQIIKEQHHHGSGELVEALRGAWSKRPTARKELLALFEQYQMTLNSPDEVPKSLKFYYNDLEKYLKTGKLPEEFNEKKFKLLLKL